MTDKGSNFKIYKQLIQLNEKIKQPNLKMGGRPDLNRPFIKKTYRWPTSTGKDAQYHLSSGKFKTKIRYHLTPIRMVIIKKVGNNKSW